MQLRVRHGRAAALAASVSRPLLQLHAARAAARARHDASTNRRWSSGMLATEDWWAVWIGLAIFAASLLSLARRRSRRLDGAAAAVGMDRRRGRVCVGASSSRRPARRTRAGIRSRRSPSTYAVFTALFAIGARSSRLDVRRFVIGFTVLFVVTWAAWIAGNELHLTMVDAAVDGRNRYRDAALVVGPAARRRRAVLARADRGACDRQLREALRGGASAKPRGPSGTSRRRLFFSA